MTAPRDARPDTAVMAEAEAWFARLKREGAARADVAAFARWRDADPAHVAAFDRVQALWDASAEHLTELAGDPEIGALLEEARAETDAPAPSPRRAPALMALAATLTLAVAAGIAWFIVGPAGAPRPAIAPPGLIATVTAERRIVALPDGSEITLDAATRIEQAFTDDIRRVRLIDGRARFSVAHDASRPFIVEAGAGSVTALGTVFDVEARAADVTVTLIEGKVEVAPDRANDKAERATLAPGEQVAFAVEPAPAAPEPIAKPHAVDIDAVKAWSEGRLVYRDAPLDAVIYDFNRYSSKPIRLSEPALADYTLHGSFQAADPQGFLDALEYLFPLKVEETLTAVVISRAGDEVSRE